MLRKTEFAQCSPQEPSQMPLAEPKPATSTLKDWMLSSCMTMILKLSHCWQSWNQMLGMAVKCWILDMSTQGKLHYEILTNSVISQKDVEHRKYKRKSGVESHFQCGFYNLVWPIVII